MTARVLVVDDIPANIKLLEARLSAEYFEVLTATNGPEALALAGLGGCDIALLDVMMPGMDGFEVCARLKADIRTAHIPVVMVTALDQPADRVRGLEAGADDFLTKPVDEVALIARVRSLSRLKVVLDELRTRAATSATLGMPNPLAHVLSDARARGRVLVVDDRAGSSERVLEALRPDHDLTLEASPQNALFKCAEGEFDLMIVSLGLKDFDGLRLCSQVRSLERTRQMPILMIADLEDRSRVLRGLDIGVNDYISRPIDRNELVARARTQLRRKRYADALRESMQISIEMALVDPLTGLNNRRYLESHLAALLQNVSSRGGALSLMILDIDHFKSVNDSYGHPAGDEVLRAFAGRIRRVIRQADLPCRFGGEEFVVIMPDTQTSVAAGIAERLRAAIQGELFQIDDGKRAIPVTVSIGLAESVGGCDPDTLFRRADRALYLSKRAGRNRVTLDAA